MAEYKPRGSKYWWISICRGKHQARLQVTSGTDGRDKAAAIESALKLAHRGKARRDTLIRHIDELLGEVQVLGILFADAWGAHTKLPSAILSPETMRKRRTDVNRFVRYCGENWPAVKSLNHVTRCVYCGMYCGGTGSGLAICIWAERVTHRKA